MAIPSGSGTEVLKRAYFNGNLNTEALLINGVANHIYTVLSIMSIDKNFDVEIIRVGAAKCLIVIRVL